MMKIKIERDVNGKVVAGIVSKTFLKNADIFGSEEYVEVQKFYATHSGATIKVKKNKPNPDKKTNKHLTYENMHLFISTVAGDEAQSLLDEMEKIKNISKIQKRPYNYVLDWFKATFPEYTSHDIFKDKDNNEVENNENTNNVIKLNA